MPLVESNNATVTTTFVPASLPAGVKQLVWFVDHWSPLTERPLGLTEIELPHGRYLYLLSIGRKPVDYAGYTFVRENAAGRAVRTPR